MRYLCVMVLCGLCATAHATPPCPKGKFAIDDEAERAIRVQNYHDLLADSPAELDKLPAALGLTPAELRGCRERAEAQMPPGLRKLRDRQHPGWYRKSVIVGERGGGN